ncbi:hypothetical protein [Desulfobacter latus]|uniref:MotA/TolQ/ExbB proton channel domain-containing protein n=1 Tax=Desulfobacter latus TaxID=2292 RepID=A0A850T2G3_9BACT|nr:hypothetical protein [Desulfobacter latus]NWH05903.1 hypothetical protein [Desulfobacter latus]
MINDLLSYINRLNLDFSFDLAKYLMGTITSSVINGIIILFFIVGCLTLLYRMIKVGWDRRALVKVTNIFETSDKENSEELFDRLESTHISKQSTVMKAIRHVQIVKTRDGNVDMASDSLRSITAPTSSWGRYIASILILLGLIGTIIGLSQAVINLKSILTGMGDNITMDSFQIIINDILGSLNFMETAFSTTLCGFISFIFLSFLDHAFLRRQDNFTRQLEAFYANLLIPFFSPKQAGDNLAYIANIMKSSSTEFIKASESLSGLAKSISENQRIYTNMAETLKDSIKGIGHSQNDLKEEFKILSRSTSAISELSENLKKTYESSHTLTQTLFEKLGDDKGHIDKLYTKLNITIESMKQFFHDELVELSGNLVVYADTQSKEIKNIELDHDAAMRLSNSKIVELKEQSELILEQQKEAHLSEMKNVWDKYEHIISSMSQTVETHSGIIEERLKGIQNEILKQQDISSESRLSAFEEKLTLMSEKYLQQAEAISENHALSVRLLEKGFQDLQEQIRGYSHGITDQTLSQYDVMSESFEAKLNELFPGLRQFLSNVFEQQAGLVKSSQNVIKQMEENIKQLSENNKILDLNNIETSLNNLIKSQQSFLKLNHDRERALALAAGLDSVGGNPVSSLYQKTTRKVSSIFSADKK